MIVNGKILRHNSTSGPGGSALTPDQPVALFRDTIEPNDTTFFNGYPGAGDLPARWEGIDVQRLFAQLGANQFLNLDCLKQCVGSDGQIYDQPVTRSNGITKNVAGTDQVDPITGQPLANTIFSGPTYENGPGYKRTGWEFQAKTAFTFLPWFLRYTGADFNYSTLASGASEGIRDPNIGDLMRPTNEPRYFTNASLRYDDGRLNIRLTHQYRTETFSCITPCGGNSVSNNYPGEGWDNIDFPPTSEGWNPGVPRFTVSTAYVDGKISYNIRKNLQVYVEARNLTKEAQVTSTGEYERFVNGAPRVLQMRYGGRRFLAGVTRRFGDRR